MPHPLRAMEKLQALAISARTDFSARYECFQKPNDLAIMVRLESAIDLIKIVIGQLEKPSSAQFLHEYQGETQRASG